MQIPIDMIWEAAQAQLRSMLNAEIYRLWFAPIRAVQGEDDIVILLVANEFCKSWLAENYSGLLRDLLGRLTGQPLRIDFHVPANPPCWHPDNESLNANPHDNANHSNAEYSKYGSTFNPRYTFGTFIVGNNNRSAKTVALEVAQGTGKAPNPLFLYGGVGLGKTHLMQALGRHLAGRNKNLRLAYVSTESFTNEFIEAVQDRQLARFRQNFLHADVLLMDDIQFLAGKERIQEEFYYTFNVLHENQKQIVLTCDRPAAAVQELEQRLISRFAWGQVAELLPPDKETRLAILSDKLARMGVRLPEEILVFISHRVRANIRRLESALIRITSFVSLTGAKPTTALAEELLRDLLHEEGHRIVSIETIQKQVAERFDIRLGDLVGKRRPENIAFPRQIAMFLARQITHDSLESIGDAFGGRDHGTVLHACRMVKDRMELDSGVRQIVTRLEQQLMG